MILGPISLSKHGVEVCGDGLEERIQLSLCKPQLSMGRQNEGMKKLSSLAFIFFDVRREKERISAVFKIQGHLRMVQVTQFLD